MIDGFDAAVTDALLSHLQDADLDVPVAWPGSDFTPPDGPYLAVALFPLPVTTATIATHDRHDGIMQVSVFWPRGDGIIGPMELAGSVVARFPRMTRIVRSDRVVRIDRTPSVGAPVQEPGWVQIPVTINWTSWVRFNGA
jgi:hypothetical protein